MTVLATRTTVSRVEDELAWDPYVDATRIHVANLEGVIRLTGIVRSYAEKLAAHEAAHRVIGVEDVLNDVDVVSTGTRTDAEIAHAVRHALEWDTFLPEERIQSTVANGWVTLEGSVLSYAQQIDASGAVRRLTGVRGVTNSIRVDPDVDVPAEAHDAIRDALQRQAGREADRLKVTVIDGDLTISGHVRSWAEKRTLVGAASNVPGVRMVCDEVAVTPYS